MISQTYLDLTCQLEAYMLTDSFDGKNQLTNFKRDWDTLKLVWSNEYAIGDHEIISDTLFNLARRSVELLAEFLGVTTDVIIESMQKLHRDKNAGYSGNNPDPWANFRTCEQFHITASVGALTRLCDKWSRFWTVYENTQLDKVGESAIDTLYDFAAYCIILMCLLEEETT